MKWKGYPSSENTWEPLESVEHTEAFADFSSKASSKASSTSKASRNKKKRKPVSASPSPERSQSDIENSDDEYWARQKKKRIHLVKGRHVNTFQQGDKVASKDGKMTGYVLEKVGDKYSVVTTTIASDGSKSSATVAMTEKEVREICTENPDDEEEEGAVVPKAASGFDEEEEADNVSDASYESPEEEDCSDDSFKGDSSEEELVDSASDDDFVSPTPTKKAQKAPPKKKAPLKKKAPPKKKAPEPEPSLSSPDDNMSDENPPSSSETSAAAPIIPPPPPLPLPLPREPSNSAKSGKNASLFSMLKKTPKAAASSSNGNGNGNGNGKKKSLPSNKKPAGSKTITGAARAGSKGQYKGGEGLAVLADPQDMFDDMVPKVNDRLRDIASKLKGRPLRIATMCSGTESPVLALDMITRAFETINADSKSHSKFAVEHVFSCEIEPYKQAYIERNFSPPLLFRDIRELGNKQAHTAYGGLSEVPGGCDILVAGTSCVDFSTLNNSRKGIDGTGESAQTFRGMMDWVKRTRPPCVILENVFGAPFDKFVEYFEGPDVGYHCNYIKLDTKDFYIPHTRQRGYVFAVRGDRTKHSVVDKWVKTVESLKRPAAGGLDHFMFRSDDPRVVRGRKRMTDGLGKDDEGKSSGRSDWGKCQLRHASSRAEENLGEKRIITGWSDATSSINLPPHMWSEWMSRQVSRIHDLTDINTLRLASVGIDQTFKTMVWNLSQNCDRDTMGKLGLSPCITPTGVPFVTSRGGPLVGEELLLLQGIPAQDLILTRETEANLKDLAGNAMTTTVVGACILAAICCTDVQSPDGGKTGGMLPEGEQDEVKDRVMEARKKENSDDAPEALVPRSLTAASATADKVNISSNHGQYTSSPLNLNEPTLEVNEGSKSKSLADFLKLGVSTRRLCHSESNGQTLTEAESKDYVKCRLCGITGRASVLKPSSEAGAGSGGGACKFEEHDYVPFSLETIDGTSPSAFRSMLVDALPMSVTVKGLFDSLPGSPPDSVSCDQSTYDEWKAVVTGALTETEFLFTSIVRTTFWTVKYASPTGAHLTLTLNGESDSHWIITVDAPAGKKKKQIDFGGTRPIAKLSLDTSCTSSSGNDLLTAGVWKICYPTTKEKNSSGITVSITGEGSKVESWQSRLGLKETIGKGVHGGCCLVSRTRYPSLNITVNDPNDSTGSLDGTYKLLPLCGTANGSLHLNEEKGVAFFLESGRVTIPEEDNMVFCKWAPADSITSGVCSRLDYGEVRNIELMITEKKKETGWRPEDVDGNTVVSAQRVGKCSSLHCRIKLVIQN